MQVADIEKAERDKMRAKVEAIIGHGINCFVKRQLIYNFPEEIFADAGVMAIEHADFDGIERLALVTGRLLQPCEWLCIALGYTICSCASIGKTSLPSSFSHCLTVVDVARISYESLHSRRFQVV